MSLCIEKGRDIQLTHKGASGGIDSLDDRLFEGKKKGGQVTGCEMPTGFLSLSASSKELFVCMTRSYGALKILGRTAAGKDS